MTSQKDQIQSLIAEIDTVLQKTSPRLPWVMSGEATQQRQVLERVRNYLVAFQTRQPIEGGGGQPISRPDLLAHDIYYRSPSSPLEVPAGAEPSEELTPQQMLQTVMQEMSYLRTSVMQPLRQDLDVLRQQRETLMQEIQQLEAQRRNYELSQSPVNQQQLVSEFLQVLMGRLQESLAQQVAQTLDQLRHQALPATSSPLLTGMPESATALTPQLEQLQALQARSDQLLVGLDSSLRVVFESLQQSIQAYQESLTQGVDRLHTLGQQGEVMVNALLNHLAQRLGQEASSYLQSSAQQFAGLETSQATLDSLLAFPEAASRATPPLAKGRTPEFPYPGIELPLPDAESAAPSTPVDAAIESWLQSVSAANQTDALELGESSLAALDLSQLELGQVDATDLDAMLSLDLSLTDVNASAAPALFSPDTLADLPESPPETQMAAEPIAGQWSELGLGGVTEEDTEDIDAALKLLEQLSQELQDQNQPLSIADAEASLDRMIAPTPTSMEAMEPQPGLPEDARDELDEFYESFFGPETGSLPESTPELPVSELEAAAEPAAIEEPEWGAQADVGTVSSALEFPEFTVADESLSLPDLEADPDRFLGEELAYLSESGATEASLEDMLFGDPIAEAGRGNLSTLEHEATANRSEPAVTPTIPEADPETWLPEPNFLDSFFDEQDAIARSESVAALEVELEPTDLTTFEVEPGIPEQVTSLTELADLFPEPTQPESESMSAIAADDHSPATLDLPASSALNLELNIPVESGFAASTAQSRVDEIIGSDDLYILAAPEEDLLPTNALDEDIDFNLDLDEAILNRLSADLSNLEAMAEQAAQILGSDSNQEDASLTLDDWAVEAVEAPTPAEPAATSSGADWLEASLEDFAAVLPEPEPEPEAEPEEPALSYADLSLDEFATALPDLPLAADASSLADLADFGSPIAEPDLSLEEFATEIAEATLPESDSSLEEFATALEATPTEIDWPETSLEDFAATMTASSIAEPEPSLEEFAAALPESSLPEGDELSLEDFAIAQAEASLAEPDLEASSESQTTSLDNLSTEPTAPESTAASATPLAIDPTVPFTLEGMDDLFEDTAPATPPPPLVTPVVPDEPLPFTLEGMDSLFEDVPPVVTKAEPASVEPTLAPIEPEPTPTPIADSPFTQENIDNLFNRHRSAGGGGSKLLAKTDQSNPSFTLEGMEDLFDDAPRVAPTAASEPAQPPVEEPPSSYVPTLERIDHLFDQVTLRSSEPPTTAQTAPLAGSIEDLFGDLPAATPDPIAPTPHRESQSPDLLLGLDDVFREMPTADAAPSESLSPTVEELAAFTLEGMDDLFVEPPTKPTAVRSEPPTDYSATATDALTLDEAFESLLGPPSSDAASTGAIDAKPSASEKKKKTR